METKSIFLSNTFWGAAVAVAVQLAPLFGWSLSVEDGNMLTGNLNSIIGSLAAVYAIWGRMRASTEVKVL